MCSTGGVLKLTRNSNFGNEPSLESVKGLRPALGRPKRLCVFSLNSEIELKIMRHFLLAGQISEKLAQANVRGW